MKITFKENNRFVLKRTGIDSRNEHLALLRKDCLLSIAEGFEALSRVRVSNGEKSLVASLIFLNEPADFNCGDVGLSDGAVAWLGAQEGDLLHVTHLDPIESMSDVRRKIYGNTLDEAAFQRIIQDITAYNLSNIQLSSFITACAAERLTEEEVIALTRAMLAVGFKLSWNEKRVFDKHCIGGLPGNCTTPILVAIAAAAGLMIPKTSSRAITSPAGTADVLETITRVNLSLHEIQEVVKREGGCLAWGGSAQLSPADDIMIRIERALDLDSEGQLIASVLSKKAAAGSTDVVIDIPVGPTAKVRSAEAAAALSRKMLAVGRAIGLNLEILVTDGTQPIGRGIGPALEAIDVIAVLKGETDGLRHLEDKSLLLAGKLLEMGGKAPLNQGVQAAKRLLDSGKAYEKFESICRAQGGFTQPVLALYRQTLKAEKSGLIQAIDNRKIAQVAKLAGAPHAKGAGVRLFHLIGDEVKRGEELYEIFAESPGELRYALKYAEEHPNIYTLEEG